MTVPSIGANAAFVFGWTALHLAAEYDLLDIVKFLVTVPGIEVDAADRKGRTAFRARVKLESFLRFTHPLSHE